MKYLLIIIVLISLYSFAKREPLIPKTEVGDEVGVFTLPMPITSNGITWFTTPAILWVNGNTGSDITGTGTFNLPFATMTGAFNYFHAHTTLSPVTVYVFTGSYNNTVAGISWTENTTDSLRSISFNSYGGPVYITGGVALADSGFHRPTDTTAINRIQSSALNNIWVINLPNQGITNYGVWQPTDNGAHLNLQSAMEVFFNRQALHLACWPNQHGNYYNIDSVMPIGPIGNFTGIAGVKDPSFYYGSVFPTNRPALMHWRVKKSTNNTMSWTNVFYRGTCGFQYTSENGALDSLDYGKDSVWIGSYPIHGFYATGTTGVSQVNPLTLGFQFSNLPEEMDTTGEMWLDSAKGNLYIYSPDSTTLFNAYIQVSLLGGSSNIPLLTLTTCANMSFNGIYFECSRGQGLNLTKCDNISVINGSITNMGGIGVVMNSSATSGCRNIVFTNDNFANMGQGCAQANGLGLSGNARTTLLPAGAVFRNCVLANWCRNYRTAIGLILTGVGDSIVNCNITDAPAIAIDFQGNNHYIGYDRIQRVAWKYSDQGAIYTDRDPSSTGNIIYGCFLDSITNVGHNGEVSAIYFDDQASGNTVTNCFIRKSGSGGHFPIHVNGGGYHNFTNIWLLDCFGGFSGIGLTSAVWNSVWIYGADTSIVKPYVGLAPYSTQYPWFSPNFFSDTTLLTNPLNNNVTNLIIDSAVTYPTFAPSSGNWIVSDTGSMSLTFKNAAAGNFTITKTPSGASGWVGYYNFNFDSTGVQASIIGLGVIHSTNFKQVKQSAVPFARVVIPHTLVTGTISNYVMTVITTNSKLKSTAFGGTVTDRNNITFASNSSGTSLSNWEIVKWDSAVTGLLEAYVKVSSINSTADTTIYMQYGSLGYTTFQGGSYGSVWGSNAYSIWHMGESLNGATQQTVYDWGPNNHPLLSRGTWTTSQTAAGQVGSAITTDGSTNYFGFNQDVIATSGDFTISGWFKVQPTFNSNLYAFQDSLFNTTGTGFGNGTLHYGFHIDFPANITPITDPTATSTNVWVYCVLTRSSGNYAIYYNGTSTATATGTNSFHINAINKSSSQVGLASGFDELQLWTTVLSPNVISTTYNNQTNLSTFPTITF